ncbi:hypothetical protein FJ364_06060, partial [Candidatus Dependentiae bacterium]|nr:hypothetical protein [Candidatus Dependentiae bacterium]
ATYIGILIAFAFYFFFLPTKYISFHKEQFKWLDLEKFKLLKIVTVLVIVLGLIGVIYVNLNPVLPKFIEGNPKISHFVKNRLSIPIVLRDITGARFSAWKITWQSIKEKPLLGWGPENSYIGFEKYYDPTLPPGLQKLWWDRPHNIFLQIWSESGIIALVLYIGFWATLFWRLQKLKKQNPDKKAVFASHGLQAMVIAYLVVLFFQFDGFTTYLISFFFIGYSFFLISSYQKTETIIFYPPIKITTFKKILIALFFLLMILFIWFWNIGPLYFNEKLSHIESINCVKKMDYIDDINPEKFGIIKSFGALKYSDFVKQCISVKPQKELEYSTKSLNYLKEALKIQPYFSRTLLFMGSFTNVIAAREKSPEIKNNLIIEARSYLEKGMELSPKRQEFLIEMEKNHLIATDYEMMKKVANDCILIDDANGACYWYLGIAQIFLGDQINGRKSIALSQEKGYLGPNIAYKQLAVAYMSQNNWQEALLAYKIVTPPSSELFPSEAASYHATLAYLYSKAG